MPKIGLLLLLLSAPAFAEVANPWREVKGPAKGAAEVIGGYSAGCLRGAQELASNNSSYQVMRPARNRFYGHPDLVNSIASLAKQAEDKGMGVLLVGDMAQPRGGPTMSDHASHQTGLDADIWYWLLPKGKTLTEKEKESLDSPNMVVPDFEGLDKGNWNAQVVEILKLAAEAPQAERILVNPVIKREVCRLYKGQPWVQKLRPWWGHDDHFHLRLKCPNGNSNCQAQEAVAPGDGCDASLEEWFSAKAREDAKKKKEQPSPPVMPQLPPVCADVLGQ